MRSGFQSPSIGVRLRALNDVFSRMFGDERRYFGDVFSEPAEVIHREVQHQIGFHCVLATGIRHDLPDGVKRRTPRPQATLP